MKKVELDIPSYAVGFAKVTLASLEPGFDTKLKVKPIYNDSDKTNIDYYLCSATVSKGNKTPWEKIKHFFGKMPKVEIRKKFEDFKGDTMEKLEKTLVSTATLASDVFSGKEVKINC